MPELATEPERAEEDKESMPTMGFLDHLEELRKRIVYSIISVAVGFFACWWKVEKIYDVMQRPIMDALKANGMSEKLVYLNPTEPFNLYLKIAALAGLFLTSPFVLYQVWMFISPGLYRHEKRYVVPFMVSTITLFSCGGYFGYKIVYPAALNFLIGFSHQFTADDHDQRVHVAFPEHHSRHGSDLRDADPGVFPRVDGNYQRGVHVEELPLFHPGDLHHCRDRHSYDRHPEHVHLRRADDCSLCFKHRSGVARASQAARRPEGETSVRMASRWLICLLVGFCCRSWRAIARRAPLRCSHRRGLEPTSAPLNLPAGQRAATGV